MRADSDEGTSKTSLQHFTIVSVLFRLNMWDFPNFSPNCKIVLFLCISLRLNSSLCNESKKAARGRLIPGKGPRPRAGRAVFPAAKPCRPTIPPTPWSSAESTSRLQVNMTNTVGFLGGLRSCVLCTVVSFFPPSLTTSIWSRLLSSLPCFSVPRLPPLVKSVGFSRPLVSLQPPHFFSLRPPPYPSPPNPPLPPISMLTNLPSHSG